MVVTDYYGGEDVIITFEKEGADTVVNMEGKIINLSISGGTSEVETIKTFGGRTITMTKATEDYEVSFDYISRDSTFSFLHFSTATAGNFAAGTEYRSDSETNRKRYRVIMWFVGGNSAGVTQSGSVIVPLKVGELMRYIFKDCYAISNDEEASADEYLKGSITFKTPGTDADSYANIFKEWTSAQGTTALTTLSTTAHAGTLTWNTTTPAWTGSYRT